MRALRRTSELLAKLGAAATLALVAHGLALAQAQRAVSSVGFMLADFDPPTLGELRAAEKAAEAARLDVVYLVPTTNTRAGRAKLSIETRRKLIEAIARDNPLFEMLPEATSADAITHALKERAGVRHVTEILGLADYRALPRSRQEAYGGKAGRDAVVIADPTQRVRGRPIERKGIRMLFQATPFDLLPEGLGKEPLLSEAKLPAAVTRELRKQGVIRGRGIYDLPDAAQKTIFGEQMQNDRIENTAEFESVMDIQGLDSNYLPERRPIDYLWTYEVPADEIELIGKLDRLPPSFRVERGGREYLRFLVHPTSKAFFDRYFKGYIARRELLFTPSASHRSLTAWRPDEASAPLSLKVSLDATIGQSLRMLDRKQIVQARIASMTFGTIDKAELDRRGIVFVDEAVHLLHRASGMGFSIRDASYLSLPPGVEAVPLFTLVHKPPRGNPRIVEMARASGMPVEEYVEKWLVRPLIEQVVWLGLQHGLVGEPHEQNVMAELRDGKLTGRFFYRDNAGFYVKPGLRAAAGRSMDYLGGMEITQKSIDKNDLHVALSAYLRQATFYSLQKVLSGYFHGVTAGWMDELYRRIYLEAVTAETGRVVKDLGEARNFVRALQYGRASFAARPRSGARCLVEALSR